MTHDELASSLARHLRGPDRMTWEDVQLGPAGSPRPDVYTIFKSFMRPRPMAYEVKVSRVDFLADVTAGKWQSYLAFAEGVVFACVAGTIRQDELPARCGLIELRGEDRWRMARRPILQPIEIPERVWLKLLIDGVEREGGAAMRRRAWSLQSVTDRLRERFGADVVRVLTDLRKAEATIADAEAHAKHIVDAARDTAKRVREHSDLSLVPLKAELCEILGLPAGTDDTTLRAAVYRLRNALKRHPATAALNDVKHRLRNVMALCEIETIGAYVLEVDDASKSKAEEPGQG